MIMELPKKEKEGPSFSASWWNLPTTSSLFPLFCPSVPLHSTSLHFTPLEVTDGRSLSILRQATGGHLGAPRAWTSPLLLRRELSAFYNQKALKLVGEAWHFQGASSCAPGAFQAAKKAAFKLPALSMQYAAARLGCDFHEDDFSSEDFAYCQRQWMAQAGGREAKRPRGREVTFWLRAAWTLSSVSGGASSSSSRPYRS